MRLIGSLNNEQYAQTFSNFLKKKGIENKVEIAANKDWGSDDYGTAKALIWIIDEDQVGVALEWFERFQENPHDAEFAKSVAVSPVKKEKKIAATLPKPKPIGPVTLYLIIACSLLLLMTIMTARKDPNPPVGLPIEPLYFSPITKALFFDYPKAYTIVDKLEKAYGFEKLQDLSQLPPDGQYLLQQYYKTPVWDGVYDNVVEQVKTGKTPTYIDAPLFEKEKQGEWWRLFTPCLLHADPIHLLFNMLWLLILGKQMEEKLGISRYILFILLTGIFSNIAQYLMSGPNFVGFSGVICAMITFIWFRQKRCPWEGYQLHPSTMGFITIFILAMTGIQVASFMFEVQGKPPFIPGIANTAHLAGAFIGYLFSFGNLFRRK